MDLDKALAKQDQDPFSGSATPLLSTAFVAAMITQITIWGMIHVSLSY